ncbi:MAG: 4-hydroxy-tetrahydrodipicolinate reductase, partial [Clostridiales bacterium]|nr:4-hydroxy-tetrahydrodipicolinate reductase [Clostridiales bacterium]
MKSILLCGCNGKMGRVVQNVVKQRDTCQVTAGVDIVPDAGGPFPVYKAVQDVRETPDVLVDFSHPSTLDGILEYAVQRQVPAVLATTGYEQDQIDRIKAAAEEVAVFFTYKMSIGINLLADLAQKAVKVLGSDFDVAIVEHHHNQT